jgi:hypothetical protein
MIDDSAERRLRQRDAEPDLAVSVWMEIPVGEASRREGKENREILHTNEILEHRDIDSAEPFAQRLPSQRLRQRWELILNLLKTWSNNGLGSSGGKGL